MTKDEQRRNAVLLCWPEPADTEPSSAMRRAFRNGNLPSLPHRLLQHLAARHGQLWESDVVEPLLMARRATLGAAADGPPRVLLRVDEFPHARAFDPRGRFGTDRFRRFHAVLAEAGVPYLLAVTPRVSRDYLDPNVLESRPLNDLEVEQLSTLANEGVTFALHGLDHRTRHASSRRRSEFCGLDRDATGERIDGAREILGGLGLSTPVFVPPFNRFDASQYAVLAERFEVVCGGPESIRLVGFGPTPVWRGNAVYLPSYPPLYGRAERVATAVERLASLEARLWAPATLHWGWEMEDDLTALRGLCRALEGRAVAWEEFLAAVATSRASA